MHRLKRRSCYHKYGNHMPLCHVASCICFLIHHMFTFINLIKALLLIWWQIVWFKSISLVPICQLRSIYLVSNVIFFYSAIHFWYLMLHTVFQLLTHTNGGFLLSSGPLVLFIDAETTRGKMLPRQLWILSHFTLDWVEWKRKHSIMSLPLLQYSCLIIEIEHAQAGEYIQRGDCWTECAACKHFSDNNTS